MLSFRLGVSFSVCFRGLRWEGPMLTLVGPRDLQGVILVGASVGWRRVVEAALVGSRPGEIRSSVRIKGERGEREWKRGSNGVLVSLKKNRLGAVALLLGEEEGSDGAVQ
ncbi:phospholipid-transporting ATPase 6 [Corchorus olitorius]|uniref:Phospholipid-transporting ATPase 6 n=1 Tax=Corchorus olitorius TaxID=93759 RepID=A0A1R3L0E9_9ROSI|nr:phospholipid-transporting ATPase 6 [Corchorus olitorius]